MGRRGRSLFTDENVFFITTTVVNFTKAFDRSETCDLLIQNIKHYQEIYKFRIFGYVIMPSHFHWIIEVNTGIISDVMRDIKKYSAWDIMEELEKNGKEFLLSIFKQEATGYRDQKRKFWMERFDDEVIRNYGMIRAKLEYIHNNPVKAGLVTQPEDYLYSSARNYILNDQSIIYVATDWAG